MAASTLMLVGSEVLGQILKARFTLARSSIRACTYFEQTGTAARSAHVRRNTVLSSLPKYFAMIGIREEACDRAWGQMFKMLAAVKEQTILHGEDAESRPMHQPCE